MRALDSITEHDVVFQYLLENSRANIFWQDKNNVFKGCNMSQALAAGFQHPDQVIGKTNFDLLPYDEALKVVKVNKLVLEDGEIFETEEEGLLGNGNRAVFLSQKIPMKNHLGEIIGLFGISFDITDKKRAEALQKELEFQQRANTMLKLWSSAIAHEMRTPLTALSMNVGTLMTIILSLEQLCTATDGSPKAKRKIEQLKTIPPKLEKTIDHANHFIDMTLMKSRAGDEEIEMNLTSLSMAAEIKAAIQSYPFRDGDEQFVNIDTKLDFKFMGESNFFHHVIFNLLKNALHYVKQADKGSILITTVPGKTDNILIFKDTGPGMSQENVDQLFKPFFSKTKHGTGVGLSLCHNLMGAFGGSISCRSVEGEFTEFKLMFPVVISDGS